MPITATDEGLFARVAKTAVLFGLPELRVTNEFLNEAVTVLRSVDERTPLRELQRMLLDQITHVERLKGDLQRSLKRAGHPLKERQLTADAMRAEPSLARLAGLRHAVWALRRFGDSIALRLLGYDRFYVEVPASGQHPGESSAKEGTPAEISSFEDAWAAGSEAILHAVTTCLRIGDVSVRGPQGWMPVEVKSDPRRRSRRSQAARLRKTRAFLRSGVDRSGEMPIARFDFQTPLEHHLALIGPALRHATQRGAAGARLEDYGNALAVDIRALNGLSREEGVARIEAAWSEVAITGSDLVIRAWSADRHRSTQHGMPYTSYPFDPDICAALACGYLSLTVNIDVRRLAQRLTDAGFRTEILLPESETAWFRLHRGPDVVTVPEGIGERILYEALTPSTLIASLHELLASPRPVAMPMRIVPLFAGESATWR